jgi:hypothetical protein
MIRVTGYLDSLVASYLPRPLLAPVMIMTEFGRIDGWFCVEWDFMGDWFVDLSIRSGG